MTTIPGPITLTWRGNELFAGSWFLGNVWKYRDKWNVSPAGEAEIGATHPTEPEARSALVAAVEKALKENERGD